MFYQYYLSEADVYSKQRNIDVEFMKVIIILILTLYTVLV